MSINNGLAVSHDSKHDINDSREQFSPISWKLVQAPKPDFKPGDGGSVAGGDKKIQIDPYGEGRNVFDNYKLLTSAVTPRPIALVSTVGKNGEKNLAPFSYFSLGHHDPPIFTLGFSGGKGQPKDTLKNLLETKECTINIISEHFVDAANYTAINAPYGKSEWELSGLTPSPSSKVTPEHVLESGFSVECKVLHSHEWMSTIPGKASGVLVILEGIHFHVGEDLVNPLLNNVDFSKLKPVSRLGGVVYGRTSEGFELPRVDYSEK